MKVKNFPEHVALIMDGNGRWAKKRFLPRVAGHNAGMKSMQEIVRRASDIGIKHLTVYAFSTENWKRTSEEVSGIFGLLVKYVATELAELNEKNVKVKVLGEYEALPETARNSMQKAIDATCDNSGMQFNIALNYGSRAEIIRAANKIVADYGKDARFTEELLAKYLYTGDENGNIPDPDLIIRTSGEERLSNFLLWQCAYSELAFTDSLWPDFSPDEFQNMVEAFGRRERRFGGRIKE
ncbi:MAG: isoprenyl transferase [Eubacterium sp.]|nr:isoprenyl transferase [Eubacterium sp.]